MADDKTADVRRSIATARGRFLEVRLNKDHAGVATIGG